MSLLMTQQQREAYLSELHVGIISISAPGRGPLSVPIWYGYEPGGCVWVVTGPDTLKFKRLEQAKRFSLCAHTETTPYQYVSVEGPITQIVPAVIDDDMRFLAHRYYGIEKGDEYIETTWKDAGPDALRKISMQPEIWYTADYGNQ